MDEIVNEKDLKKYEEHYSEEGLKNKIGRFAKKAGLKTTYYAILLKNALTSGSVRLSDKAIIIGALGYFISPFDIIPDLMIGVGFVDDLAALCLAVKKISSSINSSIREISKEELHEIFDFDDDELEDDQ